MTRLLKLVNLKKIDTRDRSFRKQDGGEIRRDVPIGRLYLDLLVQFHRFADPAVVEPKVEINAGPGVVRLGDPAINAPRLYPLVHGNRPPTPKQGHKFPITSLFRFANESCDRISYGRAAEEFCRTKNDKIIFSDQKTHSVRKRDQGLSVLTHQLRLLRNEM